MIDELMIQICLRYDPSSLMTMLLREMIDLVDGQLARNPTDGRILYQCEVREKSG